MVNSIQSPLGTAARLRPLALRQRQIRRLRVVSFAGVCVLYALILAGLQAGPSRKDTLGDEGEAGAVRISLLRRPHPRAQRPAATGQPAVLKQRLAPASTQPSDPEPAPAPASPSPTRDLQDVQAVEAFEPSSALGDPTAPCALAEALTQDLRTSALARQGLDRLPPTARSVANAVMLWDGRWNDQLGGGDLLRGLIQREIAAAPPACAAQLNRGPLFLFANQGGTTLVLAVGSGEWRWGDLIQR